MSTNVSVDASFVEKVTDFDNKIRSDIWRPNWRCSAIGTSCAGKSVFLERLVTQIDILLGKKDYFSKIRIFYSIYNEQIQNWLIKFPNAEIYNNDPSLMLNEISGEQKTNRLCELWIIEDFMGSFAGTKSNIYELFTKGSHHLNLSIFCTSQMTFLSGSMNQMRIMTNNSTHILLFPNWRCVFNYWCHHSQRWLVFFVLVIKQRPIY